MPRLADLKVAIAALTLLLGVSARAATVELTLRERGGPPVGDQQVILHRPGVSEGMMWLDRETTRQGVTTGSGKVVFDGLAPGSYTISLQRLANPSLVSPADNPHAPAPVFTLAAADDRVALTVELWRGVPLGVEVVVDRGEDPPARAVAASLDGPRTMEIPAKGSGRTLLVPGRWEVGFRFPPGYLLVDLVLNGESLPGHTARLDVTDDLRGQLLTAHLSARSLITGRIASDVTGSCPATVVATLRAPGPWLAAAQARGGSEYARVSQQFMRDCVYKLWLPDGQWVVQAEGPDVARAEPESVDVTIAAGETRSLDFKVELAGGSDKSGLAVRVVLPGDRGPAIGALVEIQDPQAAAGAEPIATRTVERYFGVARFERLGAGSYRVVAGHADYLEAASDVTVDPEEDDRERVVLVLREGARVHARATDEQSRAVSEVEVEVVREGDPPPMELHDPRLRELKRTRRELTDTTGHVEIAGFHSGRYAVRARMTGERAGTRFVRLRGERGAMSDERTVELVEGQRVELDLAVLPAASIAGHLACSDGGTLPAQASFRVFDATAGPDPWRDRELTDSPALAADARHLTGERLDRFRVGPLRPGAYLLAVRPGKNDYWSWPADRLMPAESMVFDPQELVALEAGVVEIACEPLLMLVPKVASGQSAPDLRLGSLAVRSSAASATESHEDRWFIRQLPEGSARIGATFAHPYTIPPELTLPEREHDLLRGALTVLDLEFRAVGGLIEVRDETAAAARRIAADGVALLRPAIKGTISFPGTPAGSYRVELCADAECGKPGRAWEAVAVTAARTTRLP